MVYLLLVRRKAPVLNRKNKQPQKRITDRAAVVHNRAVKNFNVREEALDLGGKMKSKVSLVTTMMRITFEKIQEDTSLVRKDL